LFATATREADPADAGTTGATANTAQQVGASIGTAVFNTIAAGAAASYLAAHGAGGVTEATAHGYRIGSVGVAIALAVAALVAGVLITSRPAAHPDVGTTSSELAAHAEAAELSYEPEA
jgi:hypothetical protein